VGEWDTLICRVPVSARPIMTMALANMQIVISRLLRSLRITKGPTRWLNGEPHRQRDNLLNRPDGHKRCKCGIDLAAVGSVEDLDLQPEGTSSRFDLFLRALARPNNGALPHALLWALAHAAVPAALPPTRH